MYEYRKKPVVIEAFQMTRERRFDTSEWPEWLCEAWNKPRCAMGSVFPVIEGTGLLAITTCEGTLVISWDDWILKGAMGELYPCKPDIFAVTHEKVEAERNMPIPDVSLERGGGIWQGKPRGEQTLKGGE